MKLPTYSVYISQSEDDREKMYQQYCKKNKLDPELEYSIYEFFDTLDKRENDESNQTVVDNTDND